MDPYARCDTEPSATGWTTVVRCSVGGAIVVGAIGGIIGLIIGLRAFAPTAPVAAVEIGVPAVGVGGLLGGLIGAAIVMARRVKRRRLG